MSHPYGFTCASAVISTPLVNHTFKSCNLIMNIFINPFLISFYSRFNADLKLSEAQAVSLRAMHLPTALQDCIQAIATAAGHSSVISALSRLNLYLLIDRAALPHVSTHSCRHILRLLSWHAAVTRYTINMFNYRFVKHRLAC